MEKQIVQEEDPKDDRYAPKNSLEMALSIILLPVFVTFWVAYHVIKGLSQVSVFLLYVILSGDFDNDL